MAMHGGDRFQRRRSLQERLGLACCGSSWGIGSSTMPIHDDDNDDHNLVDPVDVIRTLPELNSDPDCIPASPRMNLAAALAAERSTVVVAERDSRSTGEPLTTSVGNTTPAAATPTRMSLMRLLEETDDQDEKGCDLVCCVCMGRKKGAAFIPCGHTFCRVCSRELRLNRGSCPLCNRSIIEVLDIF
ncbi:putative transcription factor C2H2 family [Helianthus anomalus]